MTLEETTTTTTKNTVDFLQFFNNELLVVFVVIGIVFLIVVALIRRQNQEAVYKFIYKLVCRFEKEQGTGTGDIKYTDVVIMVNKVLPPRMRWIFPPSAIDDMIEAAVEIVKKESEKNMTPRQKELTHELHKDGVAPK